MINFKKFITETEISIDEKPLERVTPAELQHLIGKQALSSLTRHKWFLDFSSYQKAYKHGVKKSGYHIVEVYPYFPDIHKTPEGSIRPTIMLSFIISHFGGSSENRNRAGRVIQVHKYMREENSLDWKFVTSWKKDDSE